MVNECANDMKLAYIVYSFGSDFSASEVMWGPVFDIFSTIDQTFRKQFTLLNLFYHSVFILSPLFLALIPYGYFVLPC